MSLIRFQISTNTYFDQLKSKSPYIPNLIVLILNFNLPTINKL